MVSSGEHEGKYKISVAVRGKNLFNVNEFVGIAGVQVDGNKITLTNISGAHIGEKHGHPLNLLKPGKTYSGLSKYSVVSGTTATSTGYVGIVSSGGNPANFYLSYGGNFANKKIPDNLRDYDWIYFFGISDGIITYENFQIEEGATYTDYEPYIEPVIKEIYLDAPLGENESVSIDGLSTIASSVNTIRVETENAPSNIEVQYYRDINKVLANLENAILSQGGNV